MFSVPPIQIALYNSRSKGIACALDKCKNESIYIYFYHHLIYLLFYYDYYFIKQWLGTYKKCLHTTLHLISNHTTT